ncbi:IPT/TIG domain-containing protein [Candidatus Desantisbacteria bacterium]|nr:IPT/TIG domain-containing protein [Candidatus Desantisbacteria bacterium]
MRTKFENGLIFLLNFVFITLLISSLSCSLQGKKNKDDDSSSNNNNNNNNLKKAYIYSLDKSKFRVGDQIVITGYNFGPVQGSSYVKFNTTRVIQYPLWSDLKIKVIVPVNSFSGKTKVVTPTSDSNMVDFRVLYPPIITDFFPKTARLVYDTVTVTGRNFGTDPSDIAGEIKLLDVDISSIHITEWNDSTVGFIVPVITPTGLRKIYISTSEGTDSTSSKIKIIKGPVIDSITPNPVFLGDYISITGTDFIDPHSDTEYVTIAGNVVESFVWNDNEIRINITDNLTSGDVIVHTYIANSPPVYLTIKKLITGWQAENITQLGDISDSTSFVSVCYDSSNDKIHLSYTNVNSEDTYIYYSNNGSGNWNIETVDKGFVPSMTLDNSGNPDIIYYTKENTLKFARNIGSGWETAIIDKSGGDKKLLRPSTDSIMDSQGINHIIYNINDKNSDQRIKYARIDSSGGLVRGPGSISRNNEFRYSQLAITLKNDDLPFAASTVKYDTSKLSKANLIKFFETTSVSSWEETEMKRPEGFDSLASYGGISLKTDDEGVVHVAYVDGSTMPNIQNPSIVNGGITYLTYSPLSKTLKELPKAYSSDKFFDSWGNHLFLTFKAKNTFIIFTVPESPYYPGVKYALYSIEFNTPDKYWYDPKNIRNGLDSPNFGFINDKLNRPHIFFYDSGHLKHIMYYDTIIVK